MEVVPVAVSGCVDGLEGALDVEAGAAGWLAAGAFGLTAATAFGDASGEGLT
jgi:hypothetical protein